MDGDVVRGRTVLGRPSPAAASEPALASRGGAARAAWRAEGASTEWCAIRAASVVGVRHRLAGHANDDSYAWGHVAGRLVVAVADGVGSIPGSAGAAERACGACVDAALERPDRSLDDAVATALDAANRAAEGGGAATLVLAVVGSDGGVALGRVGDSTAFSVGLDGAFRELFEGPDPERLEAATAALPAAGLEPELRSIELAPDQLLVLATDGLADPWRDGPTTVAPALVGLLLSRPDPVDLLAAIDFSRQGCHDDRTVLCVWAAQTESASASTLAP